VSALHLQARRRPLALLAVVAVALAACGGTGGDGGEAAPTTVTTSVTSSSTPSPTGGLPGDGGSAPGPGAAGPFCSSIAGIQGLGADEAAGATPEQVLAQNEAMLDLLDEASANVPEGAPADVESLFDDYRTIAVAIGSAGGNVEAAYAAIEQDEPDLAARLFNPTAHLPAFEFFANHCGIRFG
jgi:hypothetical protein